METAVATPIHPLVAKAAQTWLNLAARHNVPAASEPMPAADSGFGAGGLYVRIDTGSSMESASVAIYPPRGKGRRVLQSAIYMTYRMINGKPRYGRKPIITLRSMAFQIANIWDREPDAAV